MKSLIDNALSPVVAEGLVKVGLDAVHVRDLGLATASDPVIMARALEDGRVVVSADTDFGVLLARSRSRKPSFVLFRHGAERSPLGQSALLSRILPEIMIALEEGAIVTVERSRFRIRTLPILGTPVGS